jgi:hypothetical protein
MSEVSAKEVNEAITEIGRAIAAVQRLSQSDDPALKLVFGPATQRTLIELGAVSGRLETVRGMHKPNGSAPESAPKK